MKQYLNLSSTFLFKINPGRFEKLIDLRNTEYTARNILDDYTFH